MCKITYYFRERNQNREEKNRIKGLCIIPGKFLTNTRNGKVRKTWDLSYEDKPQQNDQAHNQEHLCRKIVML